VNGELFGNDATAPYSITRCCWKPGKYVLTAMAADNAGLRGVSAPININVGDNFPFSANGFWDPAFRLDKPYRAFTVYASDVDTNGNVYVGGESDDPFAGLAAPLLKWDGTNWTQLGNSSSGGLGATPYVIKASGGGILAGGESSSTTGNYISKWHGAA